MDYFIINGYNNNAVGTGRDLSIFCLNFPFPLQRSAILI